MLQHDAFMRFPLNHLCLQAMAYDVSEWVKEQVLPRLLITMAIIHLLTSLPCRL